MAGQKISKLERIKLTYLYGNSWKKNPAAYLESIKDEAAVRKMVEADCIRDRISRKR